MENITKERINPKRMNLLLSDVNFKTFPFL